VLEAFLVSAAVVALGELGDKTQLLALVLAARYPRPWTIVAGIFVATLLNHAIAGWVGAWVRGVVPEHVLRWLLALSFFAVAAWALKPDKLDEDEKPPSTRWGVFGVTTASFFLAEIGDKTQVATVMLAARFNAWALVVAGTTLGMMLANAPVVWFGDRLVRRVPIRLVHLVSAAIFLVLGAAALLAGS